MGNYAGSVYAVYPDAIYCDTNIGMIAVLTNAHCLAPFSAVVPSTKALTRYEIREGQQVLLGNERIEIAEAEFTVEEGKGD